MVKKNYMKVIHFKNGDYIAGSLWENGGKMVEKQLKIVEVVIKENV